MIKEPTYRQAISHGWDIAKKHKLLWLFGFFATFLGQMGLLDMVVHSTLATQGQSVGFPFLFDLPALFETLFTNLKQGAVGLSVWAWFTWLIAFFVAIKILLIFVSVVSQGALIHAVKQTMSKVGRKYDVNKSWHVGVSHFWRLFFLNVVKRITVMVMAAIVGLSTYTLVGSATTVGTLFFFISLGIALFVGIFLSFLIIYAAGYIVLENMSFGDSIVAAWQLFSQHTLVSLEVGILMLLANVVAGLAALFGLLVFIAHMAIFWALSLIAGASIVWTIGLVVGGFAFFIYVVLVGTLLTTFTTTVWTYLFVKMHKSGVPSRVLHFLRLA